MSEDTKLFANGIPLYLQAAEAIRKRIDNNDWKKGDKLPSLEELASDFGIARLTMRQAVKLLEKEGLLKSVRGHGIFLQKDSFHAPHMILYSDKNFFEKNYGFVEATLISKEENTNCSLLSELYENQLFTKLEHVHFKDEVPYGYFNFYVKQEIYEKRKELFDAKPIVFIIEQLYGFENLDIQQTMTVTEMPYIASTYLHCAPSSPAMQFLRTVHNKEGEVLFVGLGFYPSRHVQFDIKFISL